jgi:hypothetical protein
MNALSAFVRHHRDWINFGYSCFDRMVLRAFVQPFYHLGHVVNFFRRQRQVTELTPAFFRRTSANYHAWLDEEAQRKGLTIVEPPRDRNVRRCDWVQPYYDRLGDRSGTAVILRCRERERVIVSYAKSNHLEQEWRYVKLYYFYLLDPQLGRMFLRVCPYFPFNVEVCLNGHEWLVRQLAREGIAFCKRDNALVHCGAPQRLQELSDAFGPEQIRASVEPLLACWVPFFTARERALGYQHCLYMTQMEYCHNLIFHKHAAVNRLFQRLLDLNRAIGTPQKLAIIFARPQFQADTRTAQTTVKITRLRTPVLKTGFKSTDLKQYIKDGTLLRTETSTFQLRDLSVKKNVCHLPQLRKILDTSNERYLQAQQDVLSSYIDRGQLQHLRQPSVSASGRRIPGLRLDDPRILALFGALTSFAYLVGKASFRTKDLLDDVRQALGNPQFTLNQLRYDLGKLRGKGLVVRIAGTQRYQLSPEGYQIAVLYQKFYHRLYAPLTAGILTPDSADGPVPNRRRAKLDRLYQAVTEALNKLTEQIGIAA